MVTATVSMNERRSYKERIRDFWDENGRVIKIGAKMLLIGLGVGCVKGFHSSSKIYSNQINRLIDKLPYCPDPDDLADVLSAFADEGVTKAIVVNCCDDLVKNGLMVESVHTF